MAVSTVHTCCIWCATNCGTGGMGCVISEYNTRHCTMTGSAHAEVLPSTSRLESQRIHGWWCFGWNSSIEVSSILLFCNVPCIYSVDVTFMNIIYGRKITHSKFILCVWHIQRAWIKNVNQLVPNPNRAKAMFKELGDIMKYCSNDDVTYAIEGFSNKYADEKKFLDYFQTNWVSGDKAL